MYDTISQRVSSRNFRFTSRLRGLENADSEITEKLDAIGNSEADLTAKQALEDAYNSRVDQHVFAAQAATYAKTFRIARTIATMLAMWPSNTEAGRKHTRPPKRKAEQEVTAPPPRP